MAEIMWWADVIALIGEDPLLCMCDNPDCLNTVPINMWFFEVLVEIENRSCGFVTPRVTLPGHTNDYYTILFECDDFVISEVSQ